MAVEIKTQEVEGLVRNTIPSEEESVEDVVDIDVLARHCVRISVYTIKAKDCPHNLGNKGIDFYLDNGHIFSLHFPLEMTVEQLLHYLNPLTTHFATKDMRNDTIH